MTRAQIEQLQASKTKELAQAESAKASEISTYAETARKWIPAISMAYGVIVAFLYFFGEINFFPAGVNVGDALLLLFLAFGYGLLSFFYVGHGFLLMTPFSVFLENSKTKEQENPKWLIPFLLFYGPGIPVIIWISIKFTLSHKKDFVESILGSTPIFFFCLAFLSISLFATAYAAIAIAKLKAEQLESIKTKPIGKYIWNLFISNEYLAQAFSLFIAQLFSIIIALQFDSKGGWYLAFASLAGLVIAIALGLPTDNGASRGKNQRMMFLALIVAAGFAALLPLIWDSSQGGRGMTKVVFEKLGLRTSLGTIHVSKKVLTTLKESAEISGSNLYTCLMSDGSALVSPINVLWHGMGKTSLISIAGDDNSKIELPSNEINLIRGRQTRCHDLSQVIHFPSGSAEPSQALEIKAMEAELIKTLNGLPPPSKESAGWVLEKVVATGNTDPLPFGEQGNEVLAQKRSEKLIEKLNSVHDLKNRINSDAFQSVALGSRKPQSQCPVSGSMKMLSECHSINRRATIRLIFTPGDKIAEN